LKRAVFVGGKILVSSTFTTIGRPDKLVEITILEPEKGRALSATSRPEDLVAGLRLLVKERALGFNKACASINEEKMRCSEIVFFPHLPFVLEVAGLLEELLGPLTSPFEAVRRGPLPETRRFWDEEDARLVEEFLELLSKLRRRLTSFEERVGEIAEDFP
jgi:hypothetical protein